MPHTESHPLSCLTVRVNSPQCLRIPTSIGDMPFHEAEYWIEDWQDRVFGRSWINIENNWATMQYAVRSAVIDIPMDDEVVYGKIKGLGHILHVTEIGEVVTYD